MINRRALFLGIPLTVLPLPTFAITRGTDFNSRVVNEIMNKIGNEVKDAVLFEPNNDRTRDIVKLTAKNILEHCRQNRIIYDYMVICDNSNNTQELINDNILAIDCATRFYSSISFHYGYIRIKTS